MYIDFFFTCNTVLLKNYSHKYYALCDSQRPSFLPTPHEIPFKINITNFVYLPGADAKEALPRKATIGLVRYRLLRSAITPTVLKVRAQEA